MRMVNWETSIASSPTMTRRSTEYSTGLPSPSKGTAYAHGEMGDLHCLLGNYDPAVNCMQHRITLARKKYCACKQYGVKLFYIFHDMRIHLIIIIPRPACLNNTVLSIFYEDLHMYVEMDNFRVSFEP
jgi:hypothetical protein